MNSIRSDQYVSPSREYYGSVTPHFKVTYLRGSGYQDNVSVYAHAYEVTPYGVLVFWRDDPLFGGGTGRRLERVFAAGQWISVERQ